MMTNQMVLSKVMLILSSIRGVFALSVVILLATDASAIAADNLAGLTGGLPALTSTEYGDGTTSYSLSLQVLALMTALTLLPSLVLGMTLLLGLLLFYLFCARRWGRSRHRLIRY